MTAEDKVRIARRALLLIAVAEAAIQRAGEYYDNILPVPVRDRVPQAPPLKHRLLQFIGQEREPIDAGCGHRCSRIA